MSTYGPDADRKIPKRSVVRAIKSLVRRVNVHLEILYGMNGTNILEPQETAQRETRTQ